MVEAEEEDAEIAEGENKDIEVTEGGVAPYSLDEVNYYEVEKEIEDYDEDTENSETTYAIMGEGERQN